jgi:hypothetical protein
VVGLSAVGVMYVRQRQESTPPVAVRPGVVGLNSGSVLSRNTANGGEASPGLSVTSDGNQGSLQGQQPGGSSGSGSKSSGNASGGKANSSSDQLPTPSQFHSYDQYKNNPTAMYIDVQPGTGKAIAKGSVVTMQYRGWLTSGLEFDETYARGRAFTFTEGAGTVVDGVAEAMFGMKEGGRRRLIIPPAVGYGAAGKDPVPPDAMMVFDVELVSVQ